ncbi:thioredoxin fold domain-containing protein [Paraburkholderia sp. A2RO-4L]|uniref:thioredoxin fold domain-containing protein n=1 Tax=Paraburkholderia sp. A2RO-4L TaxID=3028374 RepID=UPI003302498F|nr:thioredoxin fold domain-containing protein [Burkholderia vietnamiensis]
MKRTFRSMLLAVPLAIAALGHPAIASASSVSAAYLPAATAPSVVQAKLLSTGFNFGNPKSKHTMYVFFDPQCPHCGAFWKEVKLLEKDVHFVWVPVGILNDMSVKQGAALLSSTNPVAAMDGHEDRLLAHKGGMDVTSVDPKWVDVVNKNTRLLESFGAQGVPYILATDASGKVYHNEGGMAAKLLAKTLGWNDIVVNEPGYGAPAKPAAAK